MHLKFLSFLITSALFGTVTQVARAAEISVLPNDESKTPVILIDGEIKSGDDAKFRDIAAKYSDAIVILDSQGGSIVPAMDIGRTIRLREYSTAVVNGGVCASACALVWLAGVKRVVFEQGRVGFHASYRDVNGVMIETGIGNALVGHYLSQIGMGQKTVIFATAAPPDKILWLNHDNAENSGIDVKWMSVDADDIRESTGNKKSIAIAPPPITVHVIPPPARPTNASANQNQEWMADAKQTFRNVDQIAAGLRRNGFQADVSYDDTEQPSISTGYDGQNFLISFSGCTNGNCNYLEFIDWYSNISKIEMGAAFNYLKEKEGYSSAWTDEQRSRFALYHYIVLGRDGVTIDNLIDNMKYFIQSNKEVEEYIVSLRK